MVNIKWKLQRLLIASIHNLCWDYFVSKHFDGIHISFSDGKKIILRLKIG